MKCDRIFSHVPRPAELIEPASHPWRFLRFGREWSDEEEVTKVSPDIVERAVRMVEESAGRHESQATRAPLVRQVSATRAATSSWIPAAAGP